MLPSNISCREWVDQSLMSGARLRHYATNRQVAGSIPDGVWIFSSDITFRSHYGPGVDSTSNRNEYQVYPGSKGGRCVRLTTLPPYCAVVYKSRSLNLPRTPWTCMACHRSALPF
jgi:hypothetical protein